MRCKQNLTTNQVAKYEDHLNFLGRKQSYGINYFEPYALVITWFLMCSLILIAILLRQSLRQLNFILAYTQAPKEMNMNMELAMGIEAKHVDSKSHVLKLLSNLYGQKQTFLLYTSTNH